MGKVDAKYLKQFICIILFRLGKENMRRIFTLNNEKSKNFAQSYWNLVKLASSCTNCVFINRFFSFGWVLFSHQSLQKGLYKMSLEIIIENLWRFTVTSFLTLHGKMSLHYVTVVRQSVGCATVLPWDGESLLRNRQQKYWSTLKAMYCYTR